MWYEAVDRVRVPSSAHLQKIPESKAICTAWSMQIGDALLAEAKKRNIDDTRYM